MRGGIAASPSVPRVVLGLRLADRAGLVACGAIGVLLGFGFALTDARPIDGWVYWEAGQREHFYGAVWSQADAYVYPPPLAQLAGLVPWPTFIAAWTVVLWVAWWAAYRWAALPLLGLGLAGWLTGSLEPFAAPLQLLAIGNAQMLVVACAVIGLRHGAAWAPAVTTKMAPAIGWVYLALRGEWRILRTAVVACAVVVAVSFVASPGAWADYAAFVAAHADIPNYTETLPVPLWLRVPVALALLVVGARRGWAWTVPLAVGLSALTLYASALWTAAWAAVSLGASPAGRR